MEHKHSFLSSLCQEVVWISVLSKTQTHNNLEHALTKKHIPDFTQQSNLGWSKQTLLEQFLLFINFEGYVMDKVCVCDNKDCLLKSFITETCHRVACKT